MRKIKSLSDFNISLSDLHSDVFEIANNVSLKAEKVLKREYLSALDCYGIFYYFRFIEKIENSEIAERLNLDVENVHHRLYSLGWHYSKIYSENKKMHDEEFEVLREKLKMAIELSKNLNKAKIPILKTALDNKNKLNKNTFNTLGFNSSEEYIRTFYYLFHVDRITSIQIAILFDIPKTTVNYRLKKLGFNLTYEESIKRKKESKRQNYERTFRNAKVSRAKDQVKNNSSGTKNENYARTLLASFLYDYFSSEIFDIVVGVNTTGVLGTKEADIPIFIYNRESRNLYKFVVEYNGAYFHTDEEDEVKKKVASNRGWTYISLIEENNNRFSNSHKLIELAVREVCNKINNNVVNKNGIIVSDDLKQL